MTYVLHVNKYEPGSAQPMKTLSAWIVSEHNEALDTVKETAVIHDVHYICGYNIKCIFAGEMHLALYSD